MSTQRPLPAKVAERAVASIDTLQAGESKSIELEKTAFAKLEINVKSPVVNARVTVQQLTERPAEIEIVAPRLTYACLKIDTENITDANVDLVTTTFKVEKSWIEEHRIDEATIKLYRYDVATTRWVQLPTEKIGEDDTHVYFSAESPSLSVFAITGEKTGEKKATPFLNLLLIGVLFAVLAIIAVFVVLHKRRRPR